MHNPRRSIFRPPTFRNVALLPRWWPRIEDIRCRSQRARRPQSVIANVDYNSAGIGAPFRRRPWGCDCRPAGRLGGAQLTWFDRSGQQIGTVGPPGEVRSPALTGGRSHRIHLSGPKKRQSGCIVDRFRAASSRRSLETSRTTGTRCGLETANSAVRLGSRRQTGNDAHMKNRLDAAAGDSLLTASGSPTDWSRDGRWIAFVEYNHDKAGLTQIVSSRMA